MNAPIVAAVHEILALTKIYRELERLRLLQIGAQVCDCRRAVQQLTSGDPPMAKPAPGAQLAALVKSAESGGLRNVVARALGSLADGKSAFGDLHGTIAEYDSAVLNAKKLAEFLRGELQGAGDNGAPPDVEVKPELVKVAAADVGNVADVLGNSSASSQASSAPPAPAAAPIEAPAQAGSPAPSAAPGGAAAEAFKEVAFAPGSRRPDGQ